MRYFVALITVVCFALTAYPAVAKYADLAGSWYQEDPDALRSEIEKDISGASAPVPAVTGKIIAMIAPHAGLRYSGNVAGYAYKALAVQKPSTVIVIGFSHKRYIPGHVAIFTGEQFVTPLGAVKTDMEFVRELMTIDNRFQSMPDVIKAENSLELQVPFIQVAAPGAKLVLIAMTDQMTENCQALANDLYSMLKARSDCVIIASSDMSHYLTYDDARTRDNATIDAVKAFLPKEFYQDSLLANHEIMCGYGAVYTAMETAKKLGADKAVVLKYANSGDMTGMKDRVVGYMSALFVKSSGAASVAPPAGKADSAVVKKEGIGMYNASQRKELLKIARDTIKYKLETGKRFEPVVTDPALKRDMGAFVTLHKRGELRGCIGHMIASGPLYLVVRDMAIAAATEDPRFVPVTAGELKDVDLEISVLTPMSKVAGADSVKIPGNGVMVRSGFRSGVYLPQVADETGWTKEEFMNSLCEHKAGIPRDSWKTGACEIYVFTAEVFGEKNSGKE